MCGPHLGFVGQIRVYFSSSAVERHHLERLWSWVNLNLAAMEKAKIRFRSFQRRKYLHNRKTVYFCHCLPLFQMREVNANEKLKIQYCYSLFWWRIHVMLAGMHCSIELLHDFLRHIDARRGNAKESHLAQSIADLTGNNKINANKRVAWKACCSIRCHIHTPHRTSSNGRFPYLLWSNE